MENRNQQYKPEQPRPQYTPQQQRLIREMSEEQLYKIVKAAVSSALWGVVGFLFGLSVALSIIYALVF